MRFAPILGLVTLAACGNATPSGGGDAGESPADAGENPADAGSLPDAGPDLTEAAFDRTKVLQVEVTLDADDWDVLRHQVRNFLERRGPDCLVKPQERPYDYFPATVSIDGVVVANVGVRKKGFLGSVEPERPSLKIKFDEYVPKQRYSGLQRMTLNNNRQDKPKMQQCLTYDFFAKLGLPVVRCSFARVQVNGEDLGLYTHVESYKKQFLRRHFDDDEGDLFEGAGADFFPGFVNILEPKTSSTSIERVGFPESIALFEKPDDEFNAEVGDYFEIDEFYSYWAAEVMVWHSDSYTDGPNNFFFYKEPGKKIRFMPWGTDITMRERGVYGSTPVPVITYAKGLLPSRLWNIPAHRAAYLARITELATEEWDEVAMIEAVDTYEALLTPYLLPSETAEYASEIQQLRYFINQRQATIEGLLLQPEPEFPPRVPGNPCRDLLGSTSGSFSTTYGTLGQNPLVAGTTTNFVLTYNDQTIVFDTTGSRSGEHTDEVGRVDLVGYEADGTTWRAELRLNNRVFRPGTEEFNIWEVNGTLFRTPVAGAEETLAIFFGEVTLSAAEQTAAAPVVGSFQATLLSTD